MASRPHVLQTLLDFYPDAAYLEIGVENGTTFHQLRAARKVAVDPRFQFPASDREPGTAYYELTSDEYFKGLDRDTPKFDVIYLDGLHIFEQTLRDLLAAMNHLAADGVIVIDDVVPNSYHAALPSIPQFEALAAVAANGDTSWMGDVFKMAFFIETFMPAFRYATVADNHGQIVMWRGRRMEGYDAGRTVEAVSRLEFKDTILSAAAFRKMPFDAIVAEARMDLRK